MSIYPNFGFMVCGTNTKPDFVSCKKYVRDRKMSFMPSFAYIIFETLLSELFIPRAGNSNYFLKFLIYSPKIPWIPNTAIAMEKISVIPTKIFLKGVNLCLPITSFLFARMSIRRITNGVTTAKKA